MLITKFENSRDNSPYDYMRETIREATKRERNPSLNEFWEMLRIAHKMNAEEFQECFGFELKEDRFSDMFKNPEFTCSEFISVYNQYMYETDHPKVGDIVMDKETGDTFWVFGLEPLDVLDGEDPEVISETKYACFSPYSLKCEYIPGSKLRRIHGHIKSVEDFIDYRDRFLQAEASKDK